MSTALNLTVGGRPFEPLKPYHWNPMVGVNASGDPVLVALNADGSMQWTLAAGTAVIGKVSIDQTTPGTTDRVTAGGTTALCASTVTFSVGGAAATGDYVGTSATPQSFASAVRTSGGTGVVQSLVITDKTTTTPVDMELWLFSATFTAPTDNAAWDISDAHALLCMGVIEIPAANWKATSNNQVCTVKNIGLPVKPAATSIFYALVTRGTTPSWATGDVQLTLGVLQD